ncbi:TetR/AcrR family transcriptional regulator [Lactobacillus sp. LC28-10]|uniref:TetR/AcrR family transcriptional regulator n=1 Tax=Secundilactobacillus angelensis TaxID=2722706 RepID=A0ABX1KYP9_9LACO|nr:TetR/AcrR family transcriptional regulator [Secundilactobacillus angelensis]MCH5462767.1 TetR/AcrR family transcriptional regulator [Secundilactobacillus angelensis]NLR19079.1 TetR/AcrR family transcriptional regulator [Secundilactobacillus angelensis]
MTSRTLTTEKIIQTAMSLIAAQKPLTFSNISRELGTHSQALYNYFPDVSTLSASIDETYNSGLVNELQQQLLGLSGEEAILKFATVSRQYALEHFKITQFVLAIPRELLNENAAKAPSSEQLKSILYQLLQTMNIDERHRLNAARMIRNLIIGEIVNVGRGWFTTKSVKESESFKQMLLLALHHLDEL